MRVEGETSRRLFAALKERTLPGGFAVPVAASESSGTGSAPEPLPDDSFRVSPETAEALERNRPGPMDPAGYARFVMSFRWTLGQLRAIPTSEGLSRFTLDD